MGRPETRRDNDACGSPAASGVTTPACRRQLFSPVASCTDPTPTARIGHDSQRPVFAPAPHQNEALRSARVRQFLPQLDTEGNGLRLAVFRASLRHLRLPRLGHGRAVLQSRVMEPEGRVLGEAATNDEIEG